MKYKVTVGTLFIGGQKYRRGDIVELADAKEFGPRVEPITEPTVVEKPARKPRVRKVTE